MKITTLKLILSAILLACVFPAYATSVVQVWSCQLEDGKTSKDAEALSLEWLKAANAMKGGEGMEVYLNYPVAADVDGGTFEFVLIVPSFEAWGVFEDGYQGSPAAAVDEKFPSLAECSGSSLWASTKLE